MAMSVTIKQVLAKRFGGNIRFNEPMADHTAFRIGGPAEAFVLPETVDDIMDLLHVLDAENIDRFVLGGGTNLLVQDGGIPGVVISPAPGLSDIKWGPETSEGTAVTAQSGVSLWELCRIVSQKGLSGMAFAAGIPGTIGGAVMMNAGTSEGDMSDVVASIDLVTGPGAFRPIEREEMTFAYRSLTLPADTAGAPGRPCIIVSATLMLGPSDPAQVTEQMEKRLMKRKASQPGGFSAGSFFKNPPQGLPAAALIDQAGLKGYAVGGAVVSEKHANFIMNRKNASAGEVLVLMEIVRKRVYDAFGVLLEPEVKIIGLPE